MRDRQQTDTESDIIELEEIELDLGTPESLVEETEGIELEPVVLLEDEGINEQLDEEVIELFDDDNVLEDDPIIELEDLGFEDNDIGEIVDERMFADIADIPLYEDELPDEVEQVEREGINIDPKESLADMIEFASMRLGFLEESIGGNIAYSDNNSKELFYSVIDSRELSFLTTDDQARLLTLVEGFDNEEQILRIFLSSRRLDKRQQLELTAYLRQMMARYRTYLEKMEVLSSIRSSINKFIIQKFIAEPSEALITLENFAGTDKVSYVKWVKVLRDHTEYCCGNCEHLNTTVQGFFKIIISERSFVRENIMLFPMAKICQSCGHLNIFTSMEHQSMNAHFNAKYEDLLSDWKRNQHKLSSFGNMIAYDVGKDVMPAVKPEVYVKDSEVVVEAVDELTYDAYMMHQWYLETKDVIRKISKRPTVNKPVVKVVEGRRTYDEQDFRDRIRYVTRLYCNMFREDYGFLHTNSLNSLLLYLKDNPTLYNSLTKDAVYKLESLSLCAGYLDSDLDDTDWDNVFRLLHKDLNIPYESPLVDGVMDLEKKREIEARVREELQDVASNIEASSRRQAQAVDSLQSLSILFRHVDIKQNVQVNASDCNGVLLNEGIKEWLEHVSDLMILTKLSPEILDFWKTLSEGKVKNKPVADMKRKTKTIKEIVTALFKDYRKEYQALEDDAQGNLVPSPQLYIDDMLSVGFTNMNLLSSIYSLKTSIETIDYYTFSSAVVELHDKFFEESQAFAGFRKFLSEAYPDCKKLQDELQANSTGNNVLDYYLYHYGDMFTLDEIKDSRDLHMSVKPSFKLAREQGETFSNYLKRLRTTKVHEVTIERDKDAAKIREYSGYYPSIYGVFEYYRYYSANRDRARIKTLMNDLVYYSYFFGTKYMLRFLGLVPLPLEEWDTSQDFDGAIVDVQDYRFRFILDNLIYRSLDYNVVASGDGDEDEGLTDWANVIKDDPDEFREQTKYFAEFGDEVIEYYIS